MQQCAQLTAAQSASRWTCECSVQPGLGRDGSTQKTGIAGDVGDPDVYQRIGLVLFPFFYLAVYLGILRLVKA